MCSSAFACAINYKMRCALRLMATAAGVLLTNSSRIVKCIACLRQLHFVPPNKFMKVRFFSLLEFCHATPSKIIPPTPASRFCYINIHCTNTHMHGFGPHPRLIPLVVGIPICGCLTSQALSSAR
jgi:hypothetical protein